MTTKPTLFCDPEPRDRRFPWWASNWAIVLYGVVCSLSVFLATYWQIADYGFTLFVIAPLVVSAVSGYLSAWSGRQTVLGCVGLTTLGLLLPGCALLVSQWEGIICIVMAAPLVAFECLLGCMVGYGIGLALMPGANLNITRSIVFLSIPLLPGLNIVESQFPIHPPTQIVRSVVDVDAPPEVVWPHVIQQPDLPEATEWYFLAGIGYPLSTRTVGEGVGAERYCEFSTGVFPEVVEEWDAPRVFRFRITGQAPPMKELNPFGHTHPPHLDGQFVSERGEFRLEALPEGRTRIHATSWYHHHIAPAFYWSQWSRVIIGRIHHRVLSHVKRLAERDV